MKSGIRWWWLAGLLVCVVDVHAEAPPAAASAHALAPLAPEGHWVVRAELRSNDYDRRYDDDGKLEPLGAAFDGVTLDAAVFPSLALLGGGASLGVTSLSSSVSLERIELTLGYGLTPDVTVGGIVNYGRSFNRVSLGLAGGNVGWNPAFNSAAPIDGSNFPFAPVGGGAAAPMDAAGLNQVLTAPNFGYGYEPLESTETTGPGSALLGVLWRSFGDEHSSLVWGAGYRFGLAAYDDPDNPFDIPLDDGSDDWVGQLEYFRHWGAVDLRGLAKRTVQRADEVVMRVPQPGEVLAPVSSKERLKRDLGDFWEFDLELGRSLGDWRISTTWHRWQKSRDSYSSPSGRDTSALEAETTVVADQWRLALSWSGVGVWQRGALPLPLVARLEVQDTYAGRNMVDVRDVYLTLTALF